MKNKINVINNAGKDVVLTVNNKDGSTEIIVDLAADKVELSSLAPGQVFSKNGVGYIILEQLCDNATAVIRKELIDEEKEFDSESNNWRTSSLRKFLNDEYLQVIEDDFGKESLISHSANLLSLDGLSDYGTTTNKVSLFDIDMYRKYRKVLGSNMNKWWWLLTPNSTPSGCNSSYVQYVYSDGGVRCNDCCWSGGGVRPFFILKSNIFVSCDKTGE